MKRTVYVPAETVISDPETMRHILGALAVSVTTANTISVRIDTTDCKYGLLELNLVEVTATSVEAVS
ncbi:hypothetical protein [Gordonia sp. N1V]|uniref:hypothetical protein n=1 Tax=Gordonia sp. N1V TaxID=3034163 RepID=UPI0023E23A6D|nr:hypothetical protein [Gordonia sp. N1V]MDF3280871.1 hypothetical protein [Gordonia sp. N1V]